jgi:hypothetical protein
MNNIFILEFPINMINTRVVVTERLRWLTSEQKLNTTELLAPLHCFWTHTQGRLGFVG